jgi:hypothetical protein
VVEPSAEALRARVGLCAQCEHARVVDSARGSTFWRCAAHDVNPALPKYPRLPVLACGSHRNVMARDGG